MNVWFVRMDKDTNGNVPFDLTESEKVIHSLHGSCIGDGKEDKRISKRITELKETLFQFGVDELDIPQIVREIKQELVALGYLDETQPGKKMCDLVIRYWLTEMQEGDFVYVRDKDDRVWISRIISYVLEDYIDAYESETAVCLARKVKRIKEVFQADVSSQLWKRTQSRKTIERNRQSEIAAETLQLLSEVKKQLSLQE